MTAGTTGHFDGRKFLNPSGANGRSLRDLPRMLSTRRTPWPREIPVQPRPAPALDAADDVTVSFVGHATFLIQSGAANILTDPIWSARASPVTFAGPRRVRAPGVPFESLPEITMVLLSHNHYDHCDVATLRALERRFRPLVITPIGNARLLRSVGMRRIAELDWWERAATAPVPVALTPAQHFSARHLFDRNRALWAGFVMSLAGRRIFFAGDSGYGSHFREVREHFGAVDFALLPIGAYEPRWFMKDIHMNPEEAVRAHLDLESRQSVAMHFGTFQLTPEGVDEPPVRLAEALDAHGVPRERFRVLDCGESLRLG